MVGRSEPRNKPKKLQRQKYQIYQIHMLEKAEPLWTNGADAENRYQQSEDCNETLILTLYRNQLKNGPKVC